jgi:uncharacterized protein YndB with AHSA1/START domain
MTETTAPLCTILNGTTIQFVRTLPVPIETAWDYLTKRDLLRSWLADGVIEPRVRGRVDLQFEVDPCRDKEACHSVGTVLEWNPPTRLSYTWQEELHPSPESATYVVFELAPIAGGTQLTLTHYRLNPAKKHLYGAGWHAHFDVLAARAAGTDPAVFNLLFEQLLVIYEQLVATFEARQAG